MIIYLPDPQEIINTMEYQETMIPLSSEVLNAQPLAYNQARRLEL